jgi:hypothetical protein
VLVTFPDVDPLLANGKQVTIMPQFNPEEQAAPIRVLVANMSERLAQPVLQLIREQSDMTLVGQVQDNVNLLLAVGAGVDVVILGAPQVHPPPGICSHLLSEFPNLKILVLAMTSNLAVLYWLGLRHRQVNLVSATTLVKTIRRAYSLNPTV